MLLARALQIAGSRRLAWTATALLAAAIAVLSLYPRPEDLVGVKLWDKLSHFLAYGSLGLVLAHALLLRHAGGNIPAGLMTRSLTLAVVVATAFGAVLEGGQGLVPGRQPSGLDCVANAIGAVLGGGLGGGLAVALRAATRSPS